MPSPGCAWWHLILSNRGTWLPGDPRGFRNRGHRIHSSGDYRHRPPAGEHQWLFCYHQQHSEPSRTFSPEHRHRIGEALCRAVRLAKLRCLAISVGKSHSHLLLECGQDVISAKKMVRRLKRVSSCFVQEILPGRIWAEGGKPIRIRNREHQREVFHYILDHARKEGAWVWRFDQEEERDEEETPDPD